MTQSPKFPFFVAFAIMCPGCSGSTEPPYVNPESTGGSSRVDETAGGTGTGGTSTANVSETPGGTESGGQNETAGGTGISSTGGDASLIGKCSDGTALPVSGSSLQTVTFTIRNTSSETRYVVTAGNHCTPFDIKRWNGEQWEGLTLAFGLPFSCNGQCGNCNCDWPSPTPSAAQALEFGDSYSFDWDAKSYSTCFTPIAACPEKTKWVGASQPVAPGQYRLIVPVANSVPRDCSPAGDAGKYTCSPGALSFCMEAQQACKLESSTSVEFTLPESGNIQVDLPLT